MGRADQFVVKTDIQRLPVSSADGPSSFMTIFVARPDDDLARPLVIVCPEIFGVNEPIRQVASRIAALGYLAVAPSFVHRLSDKPEFPIDAQGREMGLSLFFRLTRGEVAEEAQAILHR